MNPTKVPSLALALLLQVVPVCRTVTVNPALATPATAIVVRCAAAVAALLGAVDAVSGASVPVYVAGVQSLLPSLPGVRTNITGQVGSPMVLRIVLGGSVGQEPQLDYFNATPLPPGLIINTNVNTNSLGLASTNYYIYGTPTAAGVWFPVTVSAGNLLYPTVASTNILISITNAAGVSPPTLTSQPQSRAVTNGSPVSFSVVATGSPSYQWRKDGEDLPDATNTTYAIPAVATNDMGSYTVFVSNAGGSITSDAAILTVLVPPDILSQPESLTVTNGGSAMFQVAATGLPPPDYQWKFKGIALDGATESSLVISNAMAADAGEYTVEVSNTAGAVVSSPALLTVYDLPLLTLTNMQVIAGVAAFDVNGPTNTPVVIWASFDLVHWTPIHTNSNPGFQWHFSDTNSPPGEARFYRAQR
jgi:Immunoglobulin domain